MTPNQLQQSDIEALVRLFHAGDIAAVESRARRLTEAFPDVLVLHNILGASLAAQGKLEAATVSLRKAIALKPDFAEAHNNLGNVLKDRGELAAAIDSFRQAIALNPDLAEAHNNLGNALKDQGDGAAAVDSLRQAVALNPSYTEAYSNLGNALLVIGRLGEAAENLRKAVALKPGLAAAHSNLGNVLTEQDQPDQAIAALETAIRLQPNLAEAHNNLGNALRALGRFDAALACFEKAAAVQPDYAEARWNEGLCRLLLGDFEQGWKLYEWRWKKPGSADKERDFAAPLWLGRKPVAGKRILLHAEQGLGDTLQFCRYAQRLAADGASVIVETQPALKSLLGGLAGVESVVARGEPLPPFDFHCPLMSLPLACETRLETIPAATPYIHVDPALVESWRSRLGARTAPRVGLVWSGNRAHKNDRNRSVPLSMIAKLTAAEATLVSLQKELRSGEAAALEAIPNLRHIGDQLHDFADTAALIALMDVVVTVDTAVAHLAGAMGKPVWVLLPINPDFRWLTEREDSPWYPTARLFRQPAAGDWQSVIGQVGVALQAHLAGTS